MKNSNRLWMIGFILFWAIAFFVILPKSSLSERFQKNALTSLVFPAQYTMYTPPPDVQVVFNYQFYKNGKLLQEINQVDFLNEKMKASYPLGAKQYFRIFQNYFGSHHRFSFLTEDYFYRKYKTDKVKDTYNTYIYQQAESKRYLQNAKLFVNEIYSEQPELGKADQVKMQVIWQPVEISFDPDRDRKFSQYMGRKVLLTETLK